MELACGLFVLGALAGTWVTHVALPASLVAKPTEARTGPAVLATPVAWHR
jgi:hypothetical protein